MRCGRGFVFLLTLLDRLWPSLLRDAITVLGCLVPLDSFSILSFWCQLIAKLLLRGVLIDCLLTLDAMELGLLSFASLGESY